MDEGVLCYALMGKVYMISAKLDHYTCIVDLLDHSGHLQEAENVIKEMPCKPNAAVWTAFLGICRIHGNMEMGKHVAKQVLELEPENAAGQTCILLLATGISVRKLNCRERKEV